MRKGSRWVSLQDAWFPHLRQQQPWRDKDHNKRHDSSPPLYCLGTGMVLLEHPGTAGILEHPECVGTSKYFLNPGPAVVAQMQMLVLP